MRSGFYFVMCASMDRIEYLAKVTEIVAELTDVSPEEILGNSRSADIVDARWITIRLLKDRGYSSKSIAPLIGRPQRSINHALCCLDDRMQYTNPEIGKTLAKARKLLGNNA